tara:strand:+ start:736 stop:1107 length:372 start_codon:yes stop_codon:yes gene_type:complete
MKYILSFCILLSCYSFSAIVYEFDNTDDEIRFNNLIKEIRCPKCTSGSLSSSNAPVSEDLKLKIAEMIKQGKSNSEIKEYVSQRFGKESLYDPQFGQDTYLLWLSPVIFIILAFILFFLRRKI